MYGAENEDELAEHAVKENGLVRDGGLLLSHLRREPASDRNEREGDVDAEHYPGASGEEGDGVRDGLVWIPGQVLPPNAEATHDNVDLDDVQDDLVPLAVYFHPDFERVETAQKLGGVQDGLGPHTSGRSSKLLGLNRHRLVGVCF